MSERCTYCGQLGHWRPDCPKIAKLIARARSFVYIDLVSTPVEARVHKLKARWSVEPAQDLEAYHSEDAEESLRQCLPSMKQVRIKKEQLLTILKKNRAEHRTIFLEAQKAFRAVAIKGLDAQLKAARTGRPFELANLVSLVAPEDHTKEYDRSIQMLEMSVDTEITVDEREFTNYVQDVWNWSREWAGSNLRYTSKNSRFYGKIAALASS